MWNIDLDRPIRFMIYYISRAFTFQAGKTPVELGAGTFNSTGVLSFRTEAR